MSDIELYWQSIASKANDPRKWTDLSRNEQFAVVNSVNLMIAVLNNRATWEEQQRAESN